MFNDVCVNCFYFILFYLRGVSFARVISEIVDTFFSRKVLASKKPVHVGSRYGT